MKLSIENKIYDKTLCGYVNIITIVMACAVFVFIKNIKYTKVENNKKLMKFINKLAEYSFYVYLIHMLVKDAQVRLFNINEYTWQWRTLGIISTYIITLILVHILVKIFKLCNKAFDVVKRKIKIKGIKK